MLWPGLLPLCLLSSFLFFFFNDTATTEIYTLSLHDALPIGPAAEPADHASGRKRAEGRADQASAGTPPATRRRARTVLTAASPGRGPPAAGPGSDLPAQDHSAVGASTAA